MPNLENEPCEIPTGYKRNILLVTNSDNTKFSIVWSRNQGKTSKAKRRWIRILTSSANTYMVNRKFCTTSMSVTVMVLLFFCHLLSFGTHLFVFLSITVVGVKPLRLLYIIFSTTHEFVWRKLYSQSVRWSASLDSLFLLNFGFLPCINLTPIEVLNINFLLIKNFLST